MGLLCCDDPNHSSLIQTTFEAFSEEDLGPRQSNWPSFRTSLTPFFRLFTKQCKTKLSCQHHHYLPWEREETASLFARSLLCSFVLNSFISASLNWSSDCSDWSWKAKKHTLSIYTTYTKIPLGFKISGPWKTSNEE